MTNSWIISTYKEGEGINDIAILNKLYFSMMDAYTYVRGFMLDPVLNGKAFEIVDGDTGEILYDSRDDEEPDIDDGIDESGFDPYMGEYSYDC